MLLPKKFHLIASYILSPQGPFVNVSKSLKSIETFARCKSVRGEEKCEDDSSGFVGVKSLIEIMQCKNLVCASVHRKKK